MKKDMNQKIQSFEGHNIRSVWNDEDEQWYFVVEDVISVLTGSRNLKQYVKRMKLRDPELSKGWVQIEHLVDEKVFRNLVPVKYRGGKNQAIKWDDLKELQADVEMIDLLHKYYNRLSGGDMHLGGESRENPIDWAELNQMATQLLNVI